MMKNKPFCDLKKAMVLADVTQRSFAEAQHMSVSHVSNLFNGRAQWHIDLAYKLLDMIGQPPETLSQYFPPPEKEAPRRGRGRRTA